MRVAAWRASECGERLERAARKERESGVRWHRRARGVSVERTSTVQGVHHVVEGRDESVGHTSYERGVFVRATCGSLNTLSVSVRLVATAHSHKTQTWQKKEAPVARAFRLRSSLFVCSGEQGTHSRKRPLLFATVNMMRLAAKLNVSRASARLMSMHVEPSLTQFETRLSENARQLLGNESPTTVLPLVRKVSACRTPARDPPSSGRTLTYSRHAHSEAPPNELKLTFTCW